MRAIVLGLALLLGGCTGPQSGDPAASYSAYTTGWVAVLKRPLTIEPGAATVRLQYGRIVARNGVQEQDPFCVVELDTVRDVPQVLQPGRFEVWRVTRSVNPITAGTQSPLRKAHWVGDDGDPSFLYFITDGLALALGEGGAILPLVAASTPEQLDENIRALDLTLSAEEMALLDGAGA